MTITESQAVSPGDETVSHDVVTGTLLRPFFVERIESLSKDDGWSPLHIVAVEITRFGFINDSLGPRVGDRLLVMAAKRLKKVFPDALAIGRMHGDHFCLAFPAVTNVDAEVLRLLDFVQRPFAVKGDVVVLSVRVGVARAESGIDSPMEQLHAAEIALHQTKDSLAKVTFFDESMRGQAKKVHMLENDLRVSLVLNANDLHRAFANDEFFIEFQPIVDTSSKEVHTLEALLRWNHPKRGLIMPGVFIPMAEEMRLMDLLGAWVLRRACAIAATWPANGNGDPPSVSVNVSEVQMQDPRMLVGSVQQALDESGLEPQRLNLEITETMAAAPDIAGTIASLRDLGCLIALDDFGVGYSSLVQLQRLRLDYVKIDKTFVDGLSSDNTVEAMGAEELIRAIVMMCFVMHMKVIIEGVETLEQLEKVRELDLNLVQGFVYARPAPDDMVPAMIESGLSEVDNNE